MVMSTAYFSAMFVTRTKIKYGGISKQGAWVSTVFVVPAALPAEFSARGLWMRPNIQISSLALAKLA